MVQIISMDGRNRMNRNGLPFAISTALVIILTACAPAAQPVGSPGAPTARFDHFTYSGSDPAFDTPLTDGEMRNPILAGFYPDPGIVQVGEDYYIVNSTFCYYPGIPVWHSKDLVSWTQISNVIDRPGMLNFDGLKLSRGVFAPTISHHDNLFYVANTCVDCGGNFVVTAKDPAGPWSDPVWMPDIGGIDPSLFWDTDGKLYVMNNDAPEGGSAYDGHRAIWIREVDPETFESVSEPIMIINGGARPEDKPIWIEGPHIYKVGESYIFSAAEGGTAVQHSQVVFKGDNVLGPYTPYEDNPVLTQRDLPEDRKHPITSVGHADFVTDPDGNWWASLLGVRPYQGDDYNTGRETFLLPVKWKDGWPEILPDGEIVPYQMPRPALPRQPEPIVPTTGNFTLTETFDDPDLPPYWITVRIPSGSWYAIEDSALTLQAKPIGLGDFGQPSFVARRQQHLNAEADTSVIFDPASPEDEAGIAAFQNDEFYYALGLSVNADNQPVVRLRKRAGSDGGPEGETIAEVPVRTEDNTPVSLKIVARGPLYDFYYSDVTGDWHPVALDQDGTTLSTRAAGGFVGAVFGMYAESRE
jgi:xylan 1,4-beta-xylosidase